MSPDLCATMTSVSFSSVAAPGLPFRGLPITPSVSHSGVALPSSLLQYPTALYPNVALPPTGDMKMSMTQFQTMTATPNGPDMNKLKSPFINRNYLELAMLVCNTFRGKLFPCPHCRYVTDRRNNLKRHISTMHQACDKVLECCGVQFTTKASLREHIMIFHHNGYSCPYCGRRFCRKALLKRHLSVHSGQKDYSCPHCDYATSHKSNLERHKRIHDRLKLTDETDNSDIDINAHVSPLPDTTGHRGCVSDEDIDCKISEIDMNDSNDDDETHGDIDIDVIATDDDGY